MCTMVDDVSCAAYPRTGKQAPIQGITGNLAIEGEGTIMIQVVRDEGELIDIETHAYYILALGT